jgi:PEP-CTERM motif-containing protein
MKRLGCIAVVAAGMLAVTSSSWAASIIFDDFNTNEGHFNAVPTFSGSNANVAATSTADRTTSDTIEGAGAEVIVLDATTAGASTRLRFLSGTGTPANNVSFTTSNTTTDGFIGLAVKTAISGWTVQLALDGPLPDLQGGVPRTVVADGAWHVYEWNLDSAADWGAVASIGGNAVFEEGVQTIDSVVFRNTAAPASSTFLMDFVAKSDSGSIAALIPEPGTASLLGLGTLGLLARRRRTA